MSRWGALFEVSSTVGVAVGEGARLKKDSMGSSPRTVEASDVRASLGVRLEGGVEVVLAVKQGPKPSLSEQSMSRNSQPLRRWTPDRQSSSSPATATTGSAVWEGDVEVEAAESKEDEWSVEATEDEDEGCGEWEPAMGRPGGKKVEKERGRSNGGRWKEVR